ncbi:MAG: hypothetical protein AABY01_04430 [Nanoarchaeota archaeon]
MNPELLEQISQLQKGTSVLVFLKPGTGISGVYCGHFLDRTSTSLALSITPKNSPQQEDYCYDFIPYQSIRHLEIV